MEFIRNPDGDLRLGDHLVRNLGNAEWTHLYAAVAFVKASGVQHIRVPLGSFGERGGSVRIAVGVDAQGSSAEGLRMLLGSMRRDSKIYVVHNESDSTFHPKVWLFENADRAELIVGSGNLTGGGLYTNYEATVRLRLDRGVPEQEAVAASVRSLATSWTTPDQALIRELTTELLDELIRGGYVLSEVALRAVREVERERAGTDGGVRAPRLFSAVRVPPAPRAERAAIVAEPRYPRRAEAALPPATPEVEVIGFVMTLQRTDAGVGQTRRGTSRRSPEVFIPLAARNDRPDFWGWPDAFAEDARHPGKYDRRGVRFRMGAQVVDVNMMTWPDKSDFRLRSEPLRSAGTIGDILVLERLPGSGTAEYRAEVIPQGSPQFSETLALCANPVRNSQKRWGYYRRSLSP